MTTIWGYTPGSMASPFEIQLVIPRPSAHHRSILAFMQTTGGKEHICIRPETQA
jgi:hypothetical protein